LDVGPLQKKFVMDARQYQLTARLVTNGSLLAADNSQLLTYSSLQ
jgi:hypothetical protein